MFWIGRVGLELLAELEYLVVDRAGAGVRMIAPDIVEQLFAAEYALGIFSKKTQQLELMRSERNLLAALASDHLEKVDFAVAKDVGWCGIALAATANSGLHAGEEFARAERLGDVIFGAELKQQHLVDDFADRAENEDWRVRGNGLEALADLAA
jgi:hypothetical protein